MTRFILVTSILLCFFALAEQRRKWERGRLNSPGLRSTSGRISVGGGDPVGVSYHFRSKELATRIQNQTPAGVTFMQGGVIYWAPGLGKSAAYFFTGRSWVPLLK